MAQSTGEMPGGNNAEPANVDTLQAKIQELEKQLQEKKIVVYTRDRKIPVFPTGCADVLEWTELVQAHVNVRFPEETDKVAFVLEHLDQATRTEVRFAVGSNPSAEAIFTHLGKAHGSRKTVLDLQGKFYSRDQQSGESLEVYMLALMEILNTIVQLDAQFAAKKEDLLKFKFANGVRDASLKRELRRVNEERKDLTSSDLRHHATTWMGDVQQLDSATPAVSNAISSDPMSSKLSAQQTQIDELKQLIKQMQTKGSTAESTSENSSTHIQCRYCKKMGHKKADCFKLKRKLEAQGNQTQSASGNFFQSAERAAQQTSRK